MKKSMIMMGLLLCTCILFGSISVFASEDSSSSEKNQPPGKTAVETATAEIEDKYQAKKAEELQKKKELQAKLDVATAKVQADYQIKKERTLQEIHKKYQESGENQIRSINWVVCPSCSAPILCEQYADAEQLRRQTACVEGVGDSVTGALLHDILFSVRHVEEWACVSRSCGWKNVSKTGESTTAICPHVL